MKIILNIHTWEIKQSGKKDQYVYDSLRIKESKGKRLYLTAIKNGIRMVEVIKTMKFEEGKIIVSFGKVKHEIGTYEEVAA
ncbi:hypothetical protein CHH83_02465 [Bacillus sp. 7586-K]|nr:hypothetical protein CHH83_02465 [Bacillus sp. 7586-K]